MPGGSRLRRPASSSAPRPNGRFTRGGPAAASGCRPTHCAVSAMSPASTKLCKSSIQTRTLPMAGSNVPIGHWVARRLCNGCAPGTSPTWRLCERLTPDPAVWDALIALEQLTNPRVRDEIGQISLVPIEERISGPGASYVMASFTHINRRGSRFSDGTFGVYYAAAELETAIAETVHHFEAFARDSGDPARMEDMRVLVGMVGEDFEDVAALTKPRRT